MHVFMVIYAIVTITFISGMIALPFYLGIRNYLRASKAYQNYVERMTAINDSSVNKEFIQSKEDWLEDHKYSFM